MQYASDAPRIEAKCLEGRALQKAHGSMQRDFDAVLLRCRYAVTCRERQRPPAAPAPRH